jgi:hypothetical protein
MKLFSLSLSLYLSLSHIPFRFENPMDEIGREKKKKKKPLT